MRHDYVKAVIRCRCGHDWGLCVPVQLAVPAPLRCSPGRSIVLPSGAVRADICCPRCRLPLFPSDPALIGCVEDALRRGRGTHVRDGAVVVDCR
jgi:hypothetical protein